MIWAGNLNRHHPLWDNDKDTHLFTQQATRAAEGLIEVIATFNLDMTLPKGTPTLQHMVTKRYSRPDNAFCTKSILNLLTQCKVDLSLHPLQQIISPSLSKSAYCRNVSMHPPHSTLEKQTGTRSEKHYAPSLIYYQTQHP